MNKDYIYCTILSIAPVVICGTIIVYSYLSIEDNYPKVVTMTDQQKIFYLEKEISELERQKESSFFSMIQESLTPINMSKVKADTRAKIDALEDSLISIKLKAKQPLLND